MNSNNINPGVTADDKEKAKAEEKERRKKVFSAAEGFKSEVSAAEKEKEDFRMVVTGKGGAGKTTLSAVLSHLFAADKFNVLAVDEDPQQNLAFSLGYPIEKAEEIIPVSKNIDYIEEKTGAKPGASWGVMLNLNPDVSDVVKRFGMNISDKINLLVIGSVIQAATGCLCPENALLDSIVSYINLREDEVILMDTQAGVEHFGRSLAEGFQNAVIISEPGFNSMQVALHSAQLADQLEIENIHLVINKFRGQNDREKVENRLGVKKEIFKSINYLPFDEQVYLNEPSVKKIIAEETKYVKAVEKLYREIKKHSGR
ncbi:MAG: AAA family ATPase [Halanaerobium sp.]